MRIAYTYNRHRSLTQAIKLTYPISRESWLTLTGSIYMMTWRSVITITKLRTIHTPIAERTSISANCSCPTVLAETITSLWMTSTTVLTAAFRFALAAVFSYRAQVITSTTIHSLYIISIGHSGISKTKSTSICRMHSFPYKFNKTTAHDLAQAKRNSY